MLKKFGQKLGFIENKYYLLFTISFCKFLFGFYSTAIGSLLVPIGNEFNINMKAQSAIFPANYIGQFFAIFLAGFLADKFGKKIVQITSLLFFSLFTIFFNFVDTYAILLALFFFLGIFGSAINTLTDASISEIFKKKKGVYLNITHIYFAVGALVQPLIFNYVYARTQNFRSIYFVLFLFTIFILFLLIFAKYNTSADSSIKFSIIIKILKNRQFLILCLFFALMVGGQLTFSHWMPTLFQKNLRISSEVSNYSLSFFWASIALGRVIFAFLAKKFSEEFLIKLQSSALFLIILVSVFFNSYMLLIIDYILVGFFIAGIIPIVVAYTSKIHEDYIGTRIGLLYAFGSIGAFVIPTIIGLFADMIEIYKAISAISIFFAFIAFYFFKKDKA